MRGAFGEIDAAFAFVERSIDEHDPLLLYLAVHPVFDMLRGDPRFSQLLRRLNLPE